MTFRLGAVLVLAAACAAAAVAEEAKLEPQKLADGVWATATPGGANAGWFSIGDIVVAVDAGANEDVGRALVAEIQKTAGKKPRYLIVTHAHKDHAGGAPAFEAAGAQVVTSEKAATGVLLVLAAAAGGAAPKGAPAKPANPLVLTIADHSLLAGTQPRRAEIHYLGPGHTQGDLIVLLPADGVLFSGDLAVNGVLPFLRAADADPRGWERILASLSGLKFDKMVPGHGTIGPRDGLADTAAYIARVNAIVAKLLLTRPSDALLDVQIAAPENAIEHVPMSPEHIANVKAVYQRALAEREKASPTPVPTPRTP